MEDDVDRRFEAAVERTVRLEEMRRANLRFTTDADTGHGPIALVDADGFVVEVYHKMSNAIADLGVSRHRVETAVNRNMLDGDVWVEGFKPVLLVQVWPIEDMSRLRNPLPRLKLDQPDPEARQRDIERRRLRTILRS